MIDPPPDFLSNGTADFEHKNVPFKLTFMVFSQSSSDVSVNMAEGPATPALLMRASSFQNVILCHQKVPVLRLHLKRLLGLL